MKRKYLPAILTLTAGLIASIIMTLLHYEIGKMLVILLITLVVFYFLGSLLRYFLDRFEAQIEEKNLDEGEVIEKEPDSEDGAAEGTEEETAGEDITE
ncbi:MAG: hypothetical protein K6A92_04240 [Lachnospiraceae bacterium]|nr:hypothetical protein [Lachnospiraceae bacterium]